MEKVVFYDGNCIVCDLEMGHYKKKAQKGELKFVDIHSKEFENYKNLISFSQANEKMHFLKDGKLSLGVDAFIEIWKLLPQKRFKILIKIISLPLIRPMADIGYIIFAKIRPYLPKKNLSP